MTPKEKAKDLIEKYDALDYGRFCHDSKECVLITVNEILNTLFQDHKIDYWKEVKQEIEKL